MDFQTARNVLELPLKFTSHDLKKHYHKQSLKFHPDKNKNDINATEKFKDINFIEGLTIARPLGVFISSLFFYLKPYFFYHLLSIVE